MKKNITIISAVVFLLVSIVVAILWNLSSKKKSDQLLNTTWKAVQFNGQDIIEEILLSNEYGLVSLKVCNSVGYGKIKITKNKIFFHPGVASTTVACEEPLMSLESNFINTFSEPVNYVIKNGELLLTNGGNKILFIPFDPSHTDIDNLSKLNQLKFEKYKVLFSFTEDRNDVPTSSFTDISQISEIDAIQNEIPEQELVANLYDSQNELSSLFYLGGDRDTYYQLFPGYYRKVFLTREIQDLSSDDTKCSIFDFGVHTNAPDNDGFGQLYKVQDCKTTIINKDTKIITQSRIQHCYVPLENSLYLAYVQVGNVIDGDYDLCAELHNSGLKEVKTELNSETTKAPGLRRS